MTAKGCRKVVNVTSKAMTTASRATARAALAVRVPTSLVKNDVIRGAPYILWLRSRNVLKIWSVCAGAIAT